MRRLRAWWRISVIGPDVWEPEANLGNLDRWDGLR